MSPLRRQRAFTLLELLTVMALIGILASIVAPMYFSHVDRAKEAVLRQQLASMRDAIDRFYGVHNRYPATLEELVDKRFLRAVPVDPMTESAESWQPVEDPRRGSGVFDIHSGAEGKTDDGKAFSAL